MTATASFIMKRSVPVFMAISSFPLWLRLVNVGDIIFWAIGRGSPSYFSGSSGSDGRLPLPSREDGPHGEVGHVLVYADHPLIARAPFRAVVQQYFREGIRLHNRALVMAEH